MTDFPLGALILPEPEAAEEWHRWRAALDLDSLSYESQQLLPALAGRLPRWLENDACAARLQGIVKMVWSRNQVRLRRAAEVRQVLLQDSISLSVIVGPLTWSLRTRDEGAIRFIPYLSVLIERQNVSKAAFALAGNGWELCGDIPRGEALDWCEHMSLTKGDDTLHLHWRLLPAPPGQALACERACLERTRTTAGGQHDFTTLSPEADLLQRLANRPHWDPVPWPADVLMMPFDQVDWSHFRALALRFVPASESADVLERLMQLRHDWHLEIPEIAGPRRDPLSHVRRDAFAGRARIVRFLRKVSARGRLLWKS